MLRSMAMTSAPARAKPMAAARPKSPNPMTAHFIGAEYSHPLVNRLANNQIFFGVLVASGPLHAYDREYQRNGTDSPNEHQ